MKPKIQPTEDRVLVRRAEAVKKQGSILLPENAQKKPQKGEVVAVGPGRQTDDGTLVPVNLKVGDVVLFANWAGSDVADLGDDYLILKESDVLAVYQ